MISLLFVCTGNICRSPMAEGFTRQLLEGVAGDFEVGSAGIMGWEGMGPTPESVTAAEERGVDISSHVARKLSPSDLARADLVVCMAGDHRETVVRMAPEAETKTFTLKELVRLLEELPPEDDLDTPTSQRVLRSIQAADALRRSGFEGDPADEDVSDPIGMSQEMYRAIAWDIEEWCRRMVNGFLVRTVAARRVAEREA